MYRTADHSELFSSPRITVAIFLLCLSVFACYANSLHNGFVQDDYYIIELNQDTLSVNAAIKAFTSVDRLVETDMSPYYRPLNRISYLIDKFLFGFNPTGYHAVNISLHLICSVLVYFTLLRLGFGSVPSLGAALLFGVHPVNSEAVNFISGRNNILATIFVLGSLLAFLHAEKGKKKGGYLLSGLLFFLGMLSKETALMLIPFLIFLKTYHEKKIWDLRNILKWDTSYILPHVLFLAAYLFIRLFAVDNDYIHEHLTGLPARIRQLVYIIPTYFSLFVAPVKLNFSYAVPKHFDAIMFPLIGKWLALIAALICVMRRRNRTVDFGLAWFIINFIPISNIVPIPSAAMAERYLYLPSIGIFAIAAVGLHRITERIGSRRLAAAAFLSLFLVFGFLTFKRNFDWQDNVTMTRSIVEADPSFTNGHFDYGYESYQRGDTTTAIKEWETVLALDPKPVVAAWVFYYLGSLSVEANDLEKGERYFLKAVKADYHNPAAHYALASLLSKKGAKKADDEYDQFLLTMRFHSFHLLTEVNNKGFGLTPKRKSAATTALSQPPWIKGASAPGKWKFLLRFPTGSELYYEPVSIRTRGNDIKVATRLLLAKSDKWSYAFRAPRFSLDRLSEVRFVFDVNCRQNIYRMFYVEFQDKEGKVLGKSYPGKETYVMYEYLLPQTPMRSLAKEACRERPLRQEKVSLSPDSGLFR